MQNCYLLAHDVGTTGDKACIYTDKGKLIASSYETYETIYGESGEVEQDPEDWYRAFCQSTKKVVDEAGIKPGDVEAISFSGHMMGCVPVDSTGNLTRKKTFLWADMRSSQEGKELFSKINHSDFYRITGGGLDIETYPVTKIPWLKKHEPEVFKNTYKFLGTKDYLVLKLTGNFVTDFSDASDTGMMDLKKGKWSKEILQAAGIPQDKLPPIKSSSEVVGKINAETAEKSGLMEGIPVILGGGDVPCAALGAGAISEGSAHACIGSAMWLSITSHKPAYDFDKRPFLLSSLIPDYYVSQMAMYSAGIALQWFKNELCQTEVRAAEMLDVSPYDLICMKASQVPPGANKLIFLPFLRGGGAPYYNLNDSGVYLGLKLTHQKEHMARALLEGVALNAKSIYNILTKHADIEEIRLIGGGSKGELWRKIICDVMGIQVLGCKVTQEANSLGAAINAGVGIKLYKDYSVADEIVKIREVHQPDKEINEKYNKLYKIFEKTYHSLEGVYEQMAELKF